MLNNSTVIFSFIVKLAVLGGHFDPGFGCVGVGEEIPSLGIDPISGLGKRGTSIYFRPPRPYWTVLALLEKR